MNENTWPFLLICGGLLVFLLAASFFSQRYSLNNIKSKTVGDGQHGTARWATPKEIRSTYHVVPFRPRRWRKGIELPKEQGVILGSMGGAKQKQPGRAARLPGKVLEMVTMWFFGLELAGLETIPSQGHNGLKYSLKAHDGTFGEWVHLKPCQIDNIVDTSGAGDWLAASFLWYFLRMFPKAQDYLPPDIIKQLLIDSQIIAAYSCLYLGAQGIFSVPDGTAFLRNRFNREIDILPPIVLDSLDDHLCKNCLSLLV